MPDTLQSFTSSRHFTVDKVCGGVGATTPHKLNNRERQVVETALRKHEDAGRSAADDVYVDIVKSQYRAPICDGALPCILPNSKPFRVQCGGIASHLDKMFVQGLWRRDFPAMSDFKASLLSDLAGNAFTSTVCMAVAVGTLVHAFPRGQKRNADAECPRTFRRLRKLEQAAVVAEE